MSRTFLNVERVLSSKRETNRHRTKGQRAVLRTAVAKNQTRKQGASRVDGHSPPLPPSRACHLQIGSWRLWVVLIVARLQSARSSATIGSGRRSVPKREHLPRPVLRMSSPLAPLPACIKHAPRWRNLHTYSINSPALRRALDLDLQPRPTSEVTEVPWRARRRSRIFTIRTSVTFTTVKVTR